MTEETLVIQSDYITLGQLLKRAEIIPSGGMAKWYLAEYYVYVNGEEEDRRGRKLYAGDQVDLPNEEITLIISN
ncbi:S4 domain-containing protein YaaA [Hutsoniella sourekii]|uniref:S4 domain-containing protein YaaA n=1 Tax=Hutsoniella sourekii TaxID=87650 RepID=UPI000484DC62|nr:S4 domain-containing protein YaaA [Hutsoniella sourekii]